MAAVVVIMVVVVIGRHGFDAGGGFGVIDFALFDGTGHFARFEAQPVEQHQFGRTDFFDVAAGDVVNVRVLVGADEVGDGYFVAANLFGDVAQNAEAADDVQRFGRYAACHQKGAQGQFPMFHF